MNEVRKCPWGTREIIQKSSLTNGELSLRFGVNEKTIRKWRERDFTEDKSSRPEIIHCALSPLEKKLVELVRVATWMSLDDLVDVISSAIPHANRSNVSRALQALGISRIPEAKRDEAKKLGLPLEGIRNISQAICILM